MHTRPHINQSRNISYLIPLHQYLLWIHEIWVLLQAVYGFHSYTLKLVNICRSLPCVKYRSEPGKDKTSIYLYTWRLKIHGRIKHLYITSFLCSTLQQYTWRLKIHGRIKRLTADFKHFHTKDKTSIYLYMKLKFCCSEKERF